LKPISLFKDVARTGFHTSIITTYSVDAAFYDGSLFQRLRTYGCENTILLADKRMLELAIEQTPESFARAGVGYAVVPVALEGCFHPKLHIRLGADGGSLVVGSANATAAGWGGNREIVASFEWWRRRENADDSVVQSLIRKAFDYVMPWIEGADQASLRRKLELIERDAAWLFEANANDGPVALEDGSSVDLFLERADGEVSILRRMIDAVGSKAVKRLIVVSPYWDARLAALRELHERLKPNETVIALNARRPEFPVDVLGNLDAVRFAKIFDGAGADRFIHAKTIIIEAEDHDHLLLGSTNCSTNALGSFDGPASNAEASMYRRLPPGSGVTALGIDLGQSIDAALITAAPRERMPPEGPGLPWPGSIEAAGKTIRWRPAPEIEDQAEGAQLKLGNALYPFSRVHDDVRLLELVELPSYPIIARIALADGRITSPVLVNDELRLQQAAPGMGNGKLRAALERIEVGENDLLDLAALAALIFSTPEQARSIRHGGGGGGAGTRGGQQSSEDQDYESAEAFRAAMEAKSPSKGEDHRLNINGPDEVSLFRIIMRGMSEGTEPNDDVLVGDTETDGNDETANDLPPTIDAPPLPRRIFTGAQVEKRRLDVFRAMKAFEMRLKTLGSSELPPPRKITAEACFILRLMVEASRRAMLREEDGKQSEIYALTLAPNALERDDTFVIRAGRMLSQLWVGSRSCPAILPRLQIGRHFDELPYDCFAMIVMSRWAAARCVMSMTGNHHKDLAAKVSQAAIQVWRSTGAWPQVDSSAELDFARRLDQALGIAPDETERLLAEYRQLSATLRPLAQAAE
jgi:hypothetical protein